MAQEVILVSRKLRTSQAAAGLVGSIIGVTFLGGLALMLAVPLFSEVFDLSGKAAPGYWSCCALMLLGRLVITALTSRHSLPQASS